MAALKLVEQGKITFDTPVSDYLPQFSNPIIVDRTDTQETSFRPAETVVTLRHLLTMTSGVFTHRDYNSGRISESHCSKEMHRSEDPISEFFRIVIVRPFLFLAIFTQEFMLNHSARESFPLYRCNSNQEQIVSRSRGHFTIKSSLFREQSPTAGVLMLLDSLWKRYQGRPWSNFGSDVLFPDPIFTD